MRKMKRSDIPVLIIAGVILIGVLAGIVTMICGALEKKKLEPSADYYGLTVLEAMYLECEARGLSITDEELAALEAGMALQPKARLKSMEELYSELFADIPASGDKQEPDEPRKKEQVRLAEETQRKEDARLSKEQRRKESLQNNQDSRQNKDKGNRRKTRAR